MSDLNTQIRSIGCAIDTEIARLQKIRDDLLADPEAASEWDNRAREAEREYYAVLAESTYKKIVPPKFYDMPRELNTTGSEARARFYRDALNAFELVKTGKPVSILMLGESGIGKSYFACWMIHELLRTRKRNRTYDLPAYWSGDYVTGSTLSARYKNAESFGSHETRDRISYELTLADLLVVDEIGRKKTQWEQDAIFDIADSRQKSTVYISNLSLEDFAGYVGSAVIDRLNPTKILISTVGCESWRV
ncbi:IstB-like ATP-binding protein [Treponema socranskii subsp. socranskii VPI DR56BR1116 = ATCC 35536]|uniref:IstB-like ATP-binding protein n=1 Tax=Treponema socranskii subsp. socranskii VPI DR56BR1116 = ATCC 35536 TaxID=1125725 RepID=U2L304_TRESO|nr:ATP-binding protein [Treponema socranskii]ERF61798.1 IstB-like ATP-binding protein [Treponema socranskii subsp. socranskii VPI DR56BR1116 = ATCC 35536]ERK05097.1 IstB-like ATP-binding protein [Treponema socranskii subsp. socranskii VPI DR56BR1116 = ATCC 35536]